MLLHPVHTIHPHRYHKQGEIQAFEGYDQAPKLDTYLKAFYISELISSRVILPSRSMFFNTLNAAHSSSISSSLKNWQCVQILSLIHISEPTRLGMISYA